MNEKDYSIALQGPRNTLGLLGDLKFKANAEDTLVRYQCATHINALVLMF
jgi:hypothetical protein